MQFIKFKRIGSVELIEKDIIYNKFKYLQSS